MEVSSSPLVPNWLFDTPWWLPAGIAIPGVALFLSGNRRRETRIRNAGAAIVVLAGLLTVVSCLVDTDVEKVLKRTDQVVQSVSRQDWTTFEKLLDPETSFLFYGNRAELLAGAKDAVADFGLRSAKILSSEARQTGPLIDVTFKAISEQAMPPYPLTSSWQFQWQRAGDEWLLYRIVVLDVANRGPEEVKGQLRRPRR